MRNTRLPHFIGAVALLALLASPATAQPPAAPSADPSTAPSAPVIAPMQPRPELSPVQWAELKAGKVIALELRPGELDPNKEFVTVAIETTGTVPETWAVVDDKEHAATFLSGVVESKVLERTPATVVVEQLTKMNGGPKDAYRYTVKHEILAPQRSHFTYVQGELDNFHGCWYIFDGQEPGRSLVVFSLHIDPHFFAPAPILRKGMLKSMPESLLSLAAEIARRKAALPTVAQ